MKKIFFILLTLIVLIPMTAQSKADYELLKKCDATTAFYDTDFSAEYTLVHDVPGQGKNLNEAIMYRRDATENYTIIITSPIADKGKGYLQIEKSVWFYDPADNRFTFSNKRDKFQNTNANTSDFAPMNFSRDYEIVSAKPSKLGAYNCVKFELNAKVDDVIYPKLKIWVTEEDGLVRKKEDYSLSGQLLRTTAIPSYQLIGQRSIPVKMLIIDNLKGKKINNKMQYEKTQITIKNVSFAKQKDSVFTKSFFERMGR